MTLDSLFATLSPGTEILKENTKKDEDNLINKKMGKFKYDLDDYNLNRVFYGTRRTSRIHSPHLPVTTLLVIIDTTLYLLVTPLFSS